jgi:flavin-dependent dehydrogenase
MRAASLYFSQIIGADGANSRTRRLITHKKTDVLISFEAETDKNGEDMIFDYLFGAVGYNWYIPWEDRVMVGSFFQDVPAAVCRQHFDDFLRTVAPPSLGPVKVRGAFIPTGQDVCLKVSDNVYFTGDAAGLVHGADGGGIVYALVSARLLAEALLTGEDYEKLMQPYVSKVAFLAENKAKHQFLANMMIIKKGQKALNKG